MSTEYEPSKELIRLMQIAIDGLLTDTEHAELETILSADPAARELFGDYLRLHGLIHYQAVATCSDWESLASESTRSTSSWGVARQADHARRAPSPSLQPRPVPASWWIAACATAAALLLGFWLQRGDQRGDARSVASNSATQASDAGSPANGASSVESTSRVVPPPFSRPPAPVATLATHADAVWRGKTLSIGDPMHEGETFHLEQGDAHISVGFGAEIKASGPCSLTFTANDRVRLSEGEIVVDVAEWAKGFTVITDAMDVVDLGTTFAVSAGVDLATEATVLAGMVRALPRNTTEGDRRSILLSEGEGLAIDGQGNQRSFTRPSEDRQGVPRFDGPTPYRPVQLHNTGIGLAEGDEDPHWRITAGPAESFTEGCYARVCVPYKRYLGNEIDMSQWVSIPEWENAVPNSVYTFSTAFNLEGYDLATTRLFGRFLADNGIQAVRVNGKPVRVESWTDNVRGQRFDHQQFRFVNVTDGLVDGRNTIEIDVFNGTTRMRETGQPVDVPNHMALRVEWYAFGRDSELASLRGDEVGPAHTPAIPTGPSPQPASQSSLLRPAESRQIALWTR